MSKKLFRLLDPQSKITQKSGVSGRKIVQTFPKKCLDFSDPMFKILQNPKKVGDIKNVKKIGVNRYEPEPEVNQNRPCCEPKPSNSNRTEPLQPCTLAAGTRGEGVDAAASATTAAEANNGTNKDAAVIKRQCSTDKISGGFHNRTSGIWASSEKRHIADLELLGNGNLGGYALLAFP